MKGSLKMFHHRGQTRHTLFTISIVSSFKRKLAVMSLGRSSQFGTIVLSASDSLAVIEEDAIIM
jgi:hypothetical protein